MHHHPPADDPLQAAVQDLRLALDRPYTALGLTGALLDVAARLIALPPAPDGLPAEQTWPERLHASAAHLSLTSLVLQRTLLEPAHFATLTDPQDSSQAARPVVMAFNAQIDSALAALIDLTAYENPDQDYPELQDGFEFQCRNVVYGRHVSDRETRG